MIKQILCIHDIKSEMYVQCHVAETIAIAARDFKDEARNDDPRNKLYKHTADYDLLHIGSFDPETGEIKSLPPEIVIKGKHLDTSIDSKRTLPKGEAQ